MSETLRSGLTSQGAVLTPADVESRFEAARQRSPGLDFASFLADLKAQGFTVPEGTTLPGDEGNDRLGQDQQRVADQFGIDVSQLPTQAIVGGEQVWIDPETGQSFPSFSDAINAGAAARRGQANAATLQAQIDATLAATEESGAQARQETTNLASQANSALQREARNALLSQGRSAGDIAQLTSGAQEQGGRSLNTQLRSIQLQTGQQLNQVRQFGTQTTLSGQDLAQQIAALAQQQAQFRQGLQTQQGQFAQTFGEGQRQFDLSLADQARARRDAADAAAASAIGGLFGTSTGAAVGAFT